MQELSNGNFYTKVKYEGVHALHFGASIFSIFYGPLFSVDARFFAAIISRRIARQVKENTAHISPK